MLDRTTQDRWDARYREAGLPGAPATVLLENAHLLPREGTALDLACGLGANALLLAERGLTSHAWDISPNTNNKQQQNTNKHKQPKNNKVKDALRDVIPPAQFD